MAFFDVLAWLAVVKTAEGIEELKMSARRRRWKKFEEEHGFDFDQQSKIEIKEMLTKSDVVNKWYEMYLEGAWDEKPKAFELFDNPNEYIIKRYPPPYIHRYGCNYKKIMRWLCKKRGFNYFDHDAWAKTAEYQRLCR